MRKGNGIIELPPLPPGTALMMPDGTITIAWMNMPDGTITFQMKGTRRNDIGEMHPVQTKAILFQALSAFHNAEFQALVSDQQRGLAAAGAEHLVKAD